MFYAKAGVFLRQSRFPFVLLLLGVSAETASGFVMQNEFAFNWLVSLTRPEVISGHHTSARRCRIPFTLSPNPSPNKKTAQRLRFPGAHSNKGIQRSWYYDINDVLLLKSENITLENSQLFITFKILVFLNKFVHRVKLSHKTYENM